MMMMMTDDDIADDEVTGHLSEGSFVRNVVEQITKFDAKPNGRRRRRRRRFRIDTEVRCVGAHPPFWPLEPARVKPN